MCHPLLLPYHQLEMMIILMMMVMVMMMMKVKVVVMVVIAMDSMLKVIAMASINPLIRPSIKRFVIFHLVVSQ